MDVLYSHCCGLDIHKKLVVTCLVTPDAAAQPRKEVRSFGRMSADVLQLAGWLTAAGCTHAAMESTGVYWKPSYNLLEGGFTLLFATARHIASMVTASTCPLTKVVSGAMTSATA
jgi:hypothetical protein